MKNTVTPIKIVYYSDVISHWGQTESSIKPKRIIEALQNPDEWSDDMTFRDEAGYVYFLDDLIGKEVQVGDNIFTVIDDKIN
jgi:hypothetical protein